MTEFDLIKRYFTRNTPGTELGVGDDAALLRTDSGMSLAVSADMLVEGTHFFSGSNPYLLGHKALAVNLSDMAAMGAQPRWALLSLALPEENTPWLEQFSAGFFSLAERFGVDLCGGDTTRGPLTLGVTILGEVPHGTEIRRKGARAGDDIWVSGSLGNAALALAHLQGKISLPSSAFEDSARSLHQPQPRIALGQSLRGLASSAIDISDGLLADLGHILEQSGVGAALTFEALPASDILRTLLTDADETVRQLARRCLLAGGDDYELCFTAAPEMRNTIEQIAHESGLPLARIGTIVVGSVCSVHTANGNSIELTERGYDHFA